MCCLSKIRMVVWSTNLRERKRESNSQSLRLPFFRPTHCVCVMVPFVKTFIYTQSTVYAHIAMYTVPFRTLSLFYVVFFFLKYFSNFQVFEYGAQGSISPRIRLSMCL